MDEDEFRREVLAALGRVEERQAADAEWQVAVAGNRAAGSQLAAIVARLEDQEDALDRLTGKVDRLAINLSTTAQAAERALTEITSLSRRVTRLETGRRRHVGRRIFPAVRAGASLSVATAVERASGAKLSSAVGRVAAWC